MGDARASSGVHELGLVPITTPAYSPESNGLAEAFVGTFKRDYLGDAELCDAETVLAELGGWFDDYNTLAPHSALGMRSPREHRALTAFAAPPASGAPPHLSQGGRSTAGPRSGGRQESGLSAPVRAANLSSPPEQKNGEHSTSSKILDILRKAFHLAPSSSRSTDARGPESRNRRAGKRGVRPRLAPPSAAPGYASIVRRPCEGKLTAFRLERPSLKT